MTSVKERIAQLNAKADKKKEPAPVAKGPPPPKVDIKEKPYVGPAVALSSAANKTAPAKPGAAASAAAHAHLDAPRDRVASVFRGEKTSDVRREVSARILSMKLFPGLRDVVLSDYSPEEHETLRTASSGLMASVMEAPGESGSPVVSPTVSNNKKPEPEPAPAMPPRKPEPPPPTEEEIAISERAAWFLAASETLDDSKPLPKVTWDDDDDQGADVPGHSSGKGAKSKTEVDAARQLVKDRMATALGSNGDGSGATAASGKEDKPKKNKLKLPEVPQWQDTAWSPAYKVEGKQAHAATMSAGVAKSVIEQLVKRATAPEIANAGFLAVTSLSLHSPMGAVLWKDLDASKAVLNCLNIHNRDSELAFNGLAAVAGLARTEAQALMDADGPTAILLAMQINTKNPRVVEQGCVTLSFLAGNNAARIKALKEAHVPAVLESLKQIHGKDPTCAFAFVALARALKD